MRQTFPENVPKCCKMCLLRSKLQLELELLFAERCTSGDKQISDSWTMKQDSPHEEFYSPSQTPYSPGGEAEFNVA